ncbi:hypothetical protein JQC92_15040 [Shewanella sp. 202IG2-18]|uniref:hypothetical protein n=1 Tax=Parashewanella hymeniacidonis TaxID=2807618 RepID=UPI00195FACB9|nr:hypothetical protein [Parashewanella hymeniacidonis]MBM7073329.1 hypothetical protein [Parashewanella hymeniacidonis]
MKSGYKVIFLLFSTLLLWACGGGGDGGIKDDGSGNNGGGNGGGTSDPVLSITLETSISSISKSSPATLTARVVNNSNAVQADKVVVFSLSDENMGTFNVANRKVATNSEGTATIELSTGSIEGATTVTATLEEDTTISSNVVVTMVGDGGDVGDGAQISVVLTDDAGNEIQAITSTQPATVTATVAGINQATIVAFETTIGDLPIKTAVTNSEGRASVKIFAGSSLGAGKITATIESGEIGDAVVVVGATNLVMGSGTPFVPEQASISIPVLSAGGTSSISVEVQDEDGNSYTQPIDVNFTSRCSTSATPQAQISSPIPTVNGVATTTYLAQGCVGNDTINVTATAGGISLSASGTIEVLQSNVGSISFFSAEPEMLTLRGTGNSETSVVKFTVLDADGNPVNSQRVNFELNTNVGGLDINPDFATTNSEGIVQAVVSTGDVSTSIRVTAEVHDSTPKIIGQSSELVVSTGLPDQDSFSLAASVYNPEALDIQNAAVTIQARLADAFNNHAPDGTVVYFTTEGGAIDASCQTENGICEVEWRSQLPAPIGTVLVGGTETDGVIVGADGTRRNPESVLSSDNDAYKNGNFYKGKYGGRVTITATAIGEESFADTNGNGRFDESEANTFLTERNVSGLPFDLPDPYGDFNEDNLFNPQRTDTQKQSDRIGGELEELISFPFDPATQDGVFNKADGKYNGVLCAQDSNGNDINPYCADGDAEPKSTYIRRSIVLVMSGTAAYATPLEDVIIFDDSAADNNSIEVETKGIASVTFTISDINNQQMPAGSVVNFSTSVGSIASASSYVWPSSNHNGGRDFSVTVEGGDEVESGILLVSVTTPSDVTTEVLAVAVNVIAPTP